MTQERINDLREVRKLINILHNHGNVIVPSLKGQEDTTASERLNHFVSKLNSEGMSNEDVENGINNLDKQGY